MAIIAQLKDADTSLTLEQHGESFHLLATRYDSTSVPIDVLDQTYGNLSEAIKAILVFYVQEWESVFTRHHLSERLAQAIVAA